MRYVTAAKKLVSFDCAIDMLAGPTEAVVYSESGNAEFLACGLGGAGGARSGRGGRVHLDQSSDLAKRCGASSGAARRKATPLRRRRCGAMRMRWWRRSREQAMEWVNRIAPEHLTVDR